MAKTPILAGKDQSLSEEERAHQLLSDLARRTALEKRLATLSMTRRRHARWGQLVAGAMIFGAGLIGAANSAILSPTALEDYSILPMALGLFQMMTGYTLMLAFYMESRAVNHDCVIIESLLALHPGDT